MKTYEKMAEDVLRRVHAYEAEKQEKRAKYAKAALAVTPVCAAAAIGVGMWQIGALAPDTDLLMRQNADAPSAAVVTELTVPVQVNTDAPKTEPTAFVQVSTDAPNTEPTAFVQVNTDAPNTEPTACIQVNTDAPKTEATAFVQVSTNAPKTELTSPVQVSTDAPNTEPTVTAPAATLTTRPVLPQNIGNGRSLFVGEENGTVPENYVRLITSYPVDAEPSYALPDTGKCGYTLALRTAMETYKDTAQYYVIVDLFNVRSEPITAHDKVYREFERLADAVKPSGTNVVFSKIGSPECTEYTLLLNATYDQLQNFPASSEYKYFLRLYNGTAEQPPLFFNAQN